MKQILANTPENKAAIACWFAMGMQVYVMPKTFLGRTDLSDIWPPAGPLDERTDTVGI